MKSKAVASKQTAKTSKVRVPVRRASATHATLLDRKLIQPALRVGAANDPLEHEAESNADRVVTMSAPSLDVSVNSEDPQANRTASADQSSQPNTDTFDADPAIPAEQQEPTVAAGEDVDTAGLANDEFSEIENGRPDNPKEEVARAPQEGVAVGAEGGQAPTDVTQAVNQPGAGRALPDGVRQFMEPRFNVPFSDVRIHDTPEDRVTAERIGARAFTYKHHIWLGKGESVDNRRLMAHELTHVVQQTRRKQEQPENAVDRLAEPTVQRGWVANKAEKIARNVPGYTLLCVILGKSPITNKTVTRNATNLIGGFLGLLPGGDALFQKLQETRVLERAFDWVKKRLSTLDITWTRVKRLVGKFIDEKPIFSPIKTAKRIFKPLVQDVITFIKDIKDKILEFIVRGALALAGPYGEKIWGVIEKAKETISIILNNPLAFAKNLISAVVKGFKQFSSNIWKHLKAGLMAWLFGTMQGMNLEMPAKLDFKGIISIALQIVGLTYANFRQTLVKKLGQGGEKKVAFIERSVEVVKILVKEGFVGIWQRVLEMIEGFKTTVIDGIRDFVINTIVMGAISWIAGLSNPIGGIVKVALAIYNMIKAFLERLDQIVALANSIFSSIGAIAKGQLKQAADFIEKTIAATIPLFLAFVAALIPVTGITKTIRTIIKKLQAPVKKAMNKMVTFLVKKAKKLFSKILGKLNKKRKVPAAGFKIGNASHKLIPKKTGNKFSLSIATKPREADVVQQEMQTETKKAKEFGDDAKSVDELKNVMTTEVDQAETALAKVKPEQQKTSTKKTGDKADKETKDAGAKLAKLGPAIAQNPFYEDDPEDGAILRAKEPRIEAIEGDADLYSERGKITSKKIDEVATNAGLGDKGKQRLSNYYENDHIPEKSMAFLVQTYVLKTLKPTIEQGQRDGQAVTEPYVGDIDTRALGTKGEKLPALTIYRPTHRQKTAKDAKRRNHDQITTDAAAETTPQAMVAKLRTGIDAEMQEELKNISGIYNSDKAATEKIRAKVRKGMQQIGTMNKALYGFEPGKPPKVKKGPAKGEGSNLPMMGNAEQGIPNFFDLEGAHSIYGAKPEGVGNYLEYDHVVEATLAEKSRDLNLNDEAIAGGMDAALEAKAQTTADANQAEDAPTAKRILTTAKGRLTKLKEPVFAGKSVMNYNRDQAGTVALYRPVHREVTAAQANIQGSILQGIDLSSAREKVIDYAVSTPKDDTSKAQAQKDIQDKVKTRIDEHITSHSRAIKKFYASEVKDFKRINTSKQANEKIDLVVARVANTLKQLRTESLALFK